jgi:hypothetical protein
MELPTKHSVGKCATAPILLVVNFGPKKSLSGAAPSKPEAIRIPISPECFFVGFQAFTRHPNRRPISAPGKNSSAGVFEAA